MRLIRQPLIFCPNGDSDWAQHTALQPTPFLREDGSIRVFVGMRDAHGRSRVGFVDVDADDPRRILRVSESPVLDIGMPGCFDENGVVPCAVIVHEGRVLLYYAGYQRGHYVRFTVYSGLAVSDDNGETFQRTSQVPIAERTDDELFFRVIHSVCNENGVWRYWYGAGNSFDAGHDKTLPRYDVRYMESETPFRLPACGRVVVPTDGEEHRIGRPYVIRHRAGYLMLYGIGTEREPYRLGYADSVDGIDWKRRDDIDVGPSSGPWDSEMMAYPAVVQTGSKTFLFYNGNDYGRHGFGFALLEGLS